MAIVFVDPFRYRMWALHDRMEDSLTEETCRKELESFQVHQLLPALGRPLKVDTDCNVEFIYGARRLFVARHLGQTSRVELREMNDREAIVAMDIENRHRTDISPYERGLSYRRCLTAGCVIFGAGLANNVLAQDAWLLRDQPDHFELSRVSGNVLRNIDNVGDLISYGESPQAIALISRDTAPNTSILVLVDKTTGQVTLSWPINARVIPHMAGPIEDLVLNDEYAYFVTIRTGTDNGLAVNSKGGHLDFNQLRLADGTIKAFSLPKECNTSHVVNFGGIPLIYAWNGFGIWEFDASANVLKRLIRVADIQDVFAGERPSENNGAANERGPGPFSDSVAVPGAGVFRLSKHGVLQQVLDAKLNPTGQQRTSVSLGLEMGPMGEFAQLFSTTFKGAPAIGVLGMQNGNRVFEYLNANSLATEWKITLAASVGAESVIPAPADAVSYVDHDKAAVQKTSASATTAMWKLSQLDRSANFSYVRILELHEAD